MAQTGEQNKKERMPSAKHFVVSANDIINCIRHDPATVYPVYIGILSRKAGAFYKIDDQEELAGIARAGAIRETSVIRMSRNRRGTYLDASVNGSYIVNEDVMPDRPDRSILMREDAQRLYKIMV